MTQIGGKEQRRILELVFVLERRFVHWQWLDQAARVICNDVIEYRVTGCVCVQLFAYSECTTNTWMLKQIIGLNEIGQLNAFTFLIEIIAVGFHNWLSNFD